MTYSGHTLRFFTGCTEIKIKGRVSDASCYRFLPYSRIQPVTATDAAHTSRVGDKDHSYKLLARLVRVTA